MAAPSLGRCPAMSGFHLCRPDRGFETIRDTRRLTLFYGQPLNPLCRGSDSRDDMNTSNSQVEIYQSPDGQSEIEVRLQSDSVWLNRLQMAELFGRDVKTIGKHVNNSGDCQTGLICRTALRMSFTT